MTRVKLASREECQLRDRATYLAWGERLSIDQFLEREQRLRAHAWSKAAMKTWLLVEEGGKILSSCETFEMAAERKGRSIRVHGIASVFTEESLRGKGHASSLLEGVLSQLEHQGAGASSILYSEVGPAIYERLGFQSLDSWEWVTDSFTPPVGRAIGQPTSLSLAAIRERVQSSHAHGPGHALSESTRILPSFDQLDWHWERERIYATYLSMPRPEFQGLAGPKGGYSLWAADYKGSALNALLFTPVDASDALSMLARADQERHRLGLGQTCFWETPLALPGTLTAALPALGWRRQKREDALAMVRPAQLIAEIPRALWV